MDEDCSNLFRELERADALCHETGKILRTDVNIYMALMSGIIGASALNWGNSNTYVSLLLIAGALISILFSILVYRNKIYFAVYIERSKELEKRLGHDVLRRASHPIEELQSAIHTRQDRCSIERNVDNIIGRYAAVAGNKFAYQMSTIAGFFGCIALLFFRAF